MGRHYFDTIPETGPFEARFCYPRKIRTPWKAAHVEEYRCGQWTLKQAARHCERYSCAGWLVDPLNPSVILWHIMSGGFAYRLDLPVSTLHLDHEWAPDDSQSVRLAS